MYPRMIRTFRRSSHVSSYRIQIDVSRVCCQLLLIEQSLRIEQVLSERPVQRPPDLLREH